MPIQKEIRDQIEKLIQTNKISEPEKLSVPNFIVKDLYPLVFSHFNHEAKQLLAKKTHNMIHEYNKYKNKYAAYAYLLESVLEKFKIKSVGDLRTGTTRNYAKVLYFGFRVPRERVGDAALKLVEVINDLATNKHAIAALEPLMTIQLADHSNVVVTYLAIDNKFESLVQSAYGFCMFLEGGIPPELK